MSPRRRHGAARRRIATCAKWTQPTGSRCWCCVDNVTDNLSSVPAYVDNEVPRLWQRGLRLWSGRCMCCAAHGLSCAITAWHGGTARTLLFDTGPDEWVFERNVERLGFDLGSVEAIVLSHGHWDHAGAMLRALEMIQLRNGGRAVSTSHAPGHPGRRTAEARRGWPSTAFSSASSMPATALSEQALDIDVRARCSATTPAGGRLDHRLQAHSGCSSGSARGPPARPASPGKPRGAAAVPAARWRSRTGRSARRWSNAASPSGWLASGRPRNQAASAAFDTEAIG